MLFDYQDTIADQAVEILKAYKIVYLSLQVRTGKTLTSLAAADRYNAKSVLFFTKKKAIASIEADYEKLKPRFELTVTNYEQAGNIIGEFDLVICDEAHCLGQFPQPAERTILLKKICAGKPIVYLSGTPSPESYSQLFHQFWISSFSPFLAYPGFYKWAKDFVTVKKKYFFNREINDYSKADWEKIKALTSHLFISYTQAEAGFTQMVEEEVLRVQMNATTYGLAGILLKKKIHQGKNGEVVLGDTAVKLQSKLHQIFSGTVIRDDGERAGVVFDSSKVDFIMSHFTGQKIAIYYVYKAERAMLLWHIAKYGYKITESPEEFNATDDKTVFISQIRSGREGINLGTADAIVILNIEYSYLSYAQVRARLQLKERTKPAKVYWVFAGGGIEEKIYERVINKQDYTLVHFQKDYEIKKEAKVA
jgi:hypothetical protein